MAKWTRDQLYETSLIREQIERAITWGRAEWEDLARLTIDCNVRSDTFESPIEAAFVLWWTIVGSVHGFESDQVLKAQQEITAQGKLYRPDFVIWPRDMSGFERARELNIPIPAGVVVELDGHEFHERTRDQVAYRNQRDRDLQEDGWKVLHFSGSELIRNPVECVSQAHGAADAMYWRIAEAVFRVEHGLDRNSDG